jgi:hypothetical protein
MIAQKGGSTAAGAIASQPLTAFEIGQIQAGTHKLYAHGQVQYRDVFGHLRETHFCARADNVNIPAAYAAGHAVGNVLWAFPDQHNWAN